MTQREINERKPYDPHNRYGENIEFDKEDLKQVIGLVGGFGILIFLGCLYKAWAIDDYKETTAVFVNKGRYGKFFKFTNTDGDTIETSTQFNETLDIGDTVWIKYSTFDEDVIEVIDRNYKTYLKK